MCVSERCISGLPFDLFPLRPHLKSHHQTMPMQCQLHILQSCNCCLLAFTHFPFPSSRLLSTFAVPSDPSECHAHKHDNNESCCRRQEGIGIGYGNCQWSQVAPRLDDGAAPGRSTAFGRWPLLADKVAWRRFGQVA